MMGKQSNRNTKIFFSCGSTSKLKNKTEIKANVDTLTILFQKKPATSSPSLKRKNKSHHHTGLW